jgi:hypothetical protein
LGLLGVLGGIVQAVIVTLFWLAIRSKDDAIRDARESRDRAVEINERMIPPLERQVNITERALPAPRPRGRTQASERSKTIDTATARISPNAQGRGRP